MTYAEMIARQQQIVDTARKEQRDFNEDEQSEFDKLQRQLNGAPESQNNGEPEVSGDGEPSSEEGGSSENERQQAVVEERQRATNIRTMCRSLGIDDTFADGLVNNGTSINRARALIIDELSRTHSPAPQGIEVTGSGEDEYRRDAVDGMLIRGGVNLENPSKGSAQFRNMSFRDLAIDSLVRDGENASSLTRMSSAEIFSYIQSRAFSPTSAFPAMLDMAINKAYLEGHKKADFNYERFTKKGTLSDFKKHDNYYVAGPAGDLLEVPENGELKTDNYSDTKRPQRQLKTYGRRFDITRQAFVNDDIQLVTKLPERYAEATKRTINGQVFDILLKNPRIYDNKALFCADHGNLVTTGTGITVDSLRRMFNAIATQKNEFGESIIIRPAIILVPVGYAFDMIALFESPTINTEGNTQAANPLFKYRSQIEVIEDPTINAKCGGFGKIMPWFLLANSNDTDFIEIDYLNGKETCTIEMVKSADILGYSWLIYHDWGISVMDFRGGIKNPGIKVENAL